MVKGFSIVSLTALAALASLAPIDAAARGYGSRNSKKGGDDALAGEFTASGVTRTTSATFKPVRTTPVQKGEFKVDLVVITFPDCESPDPQEVKNALNSLGGSTTIADYYKDYSQGITWPVLDVYSVVYEAPKPLGYYCRWDAHSNRAGYQADGAERARKLREDALKYVSKNGRIARKGDYTCYVYCKKLKEDSESRETHVRPFYPPKPSAEKLAMGAVDIMNAYAPKVNWADPLWPNSLPQVDYPANGGTLVHELGHVLGAPDFYHASEEHDGVEGAPCLPWAYGPTGMAYCRYIYNAFVPAAAYSKVTEPGDYTLSPRSTKFPMTGYDGIKPLGIFIPSSHPNYLFCIEYCKDEKPPVGNPSANGLLIHVINVTMTSPMMGPPDLCYTYRPGDKDFKATGEGANAFFGPGDSFTAESDPKALLPNLLPAGIEITNIRFNADSTCTFTLATPKRVLTAAQLKYSLMPQTEMVAVDGALPTSFRAEMNVRYRGEPLLSEYGFCYGLRKNPTDRTGALFPLYHRDRYDARIIDLKPGATYYVRSYAKNANGIRYGENEMTIKLPAAKEQLAGVTLFAPSDKLLSSWYYRRWYHGYNNDCFKSVNPLLTFLTLANYYRTQPGTVSSRGRRSSYGSSRSKSSDAIDMTRIHSNPAVTRPKARLKDVDALRTVLEKLLLEAGFTQSDFLVEKEEKADEKDDRRRKRRSSSYSSRSTGVTRRSSRGPSYGANKEWVETCARALKIKNPEEVFVSCKKAEELTAQAPRIREWLMKSQPVMVIRQNMTPNDETSMRWPLDIAIIDGIGENPGEFHVVFPMGRDREDGKRPSGYMQLENLLHRTTDAMLMFYRP